MILPITITACETDLDIVYSNGLGEVNLQLMNSDMDKSHQDWKKYLDELKLRGARVVSIHSPFTTNQYGKRDACLIEDYEGSMEYYNKILSHASYIASYYNETIDIVFHTRCCEGALNRLENLCELLNKALDAYSNVNILIENVPTGFGELDELHREHLLVPDFVDAVNKRLKRPIYTVLDICHCLVNIRLADFLEDEIPPMAMPKLEDYCIAQGERCHLVHLANCKRLGLKPSNHGTAFTAGDITLLKCILTLISKYCPNAKIVLEVSEEDYTTRPAALTTLETLKKINL